MAHGQVRFSALQKRRAPKRRGRRLAAVCVPEDGLTENVPAIEDYLQHYNDAPRRFVWTKDVDTILGKLDRCPKLLNARHYTPPIP